MCNMQTERCNIESFNTSHVPEAMELFTNPVVREFLGGPVPPEHAKRQLEGWLKSDNPYFAVTRTTDNAFLGIVDIAPYHETDKLELSYMFLPAAWGHGYARESILRILQYCKDELHITYIVSETQKKNLRSCKLLERLGYTLEKQVERFGAEQCVYGLTL